MTEQFQDIDLRTLFRAASKQDRIALAVSGGSDSMALLHLADRWAQIAGTSLYVLTVDHGLRAESAEEARTVGDFCESRGIAHEILQCDGGAVRTGNLSRNARNARYTLMAQACMSGGIGMLVTGHTLDDQAETFLLRLGRGSGVDGLASMQELSSLWGVQIFRPLLGTRRSALREMLSNAGISWMDDPTNEDDRYRRIGVRNALDTLAPLGITAQRIVTTAAAMADAREVLEERMRALSAEICEVSPLGYATLRPENLAVAPRETAHRLLAWVLCAVAGNVYRPRLDALKRLLSEIVAPGFRGATLHGCRIDPLNSRIAIQREPEACEARIPVAELRIVWDGRFTITAPHGMPDIHVAATGSEGLRLLKSEKPPLPECWSSAPRAARLCTPALWRGQNLLGIPLAAYFPEPEVSQCRVSTMIMPGGTVVDTGTEAFI